MCNLGLSVLHPFSVPQQPGSHIGMDLITDLPSSDVNTCIVVAVDSSKPAAI